MSKIKVDSLETNNQNVKFAHNGTGIVEVKGAGGADGAVSLVSSNGSNAVKIKSPAHSAGQSHTLVLPDNLPTTDTFLKVKSITGSGATAVGQLEYADVPRADLTQLDAGNITSGVVDAARFPSSFSASDGAGLKLINKTVVTTAVNTITVTLPSTNGKYLIFAKRFAFSNNTTPAIEFLDSSGAAQNHRWTYIESNNESYNYSTATKSQMYTGSDHQDFGYIAEFSATATFSNFVARVIQTHTNNRKGEFYAYLFGNSNPVTQLRFSAIDNTGQYARDCEPNTEILIYQYVES
tara:strand:+ start:2065 stop:2946 length:882 start_codon:yes stop_codon:yes gene_type:complete